MTTPEGEYYSEERWHNWLDRLESESVDLSDEDTARLRLNLQDDAVIAVAKIVTDVQDGDLDEETALGELAGVRDVVLSEVEFEDEDTLLLVDAVQTALVSVFYAAGRCEGPTPSVLADREELERAAGREAPFMMETDFVDDPDRPGAVLGPKTVPKRTRWLAERGHDYGDGTLERAHVETPRTVYGIDTRATLG